MANWNQIRSSGAANGAFPWDKPRSTAPSARATSQPKESDAISVSQASQLANGALRGIGSFAVIGEVSGFKGPDARGHCYFNIKDDKSVLRAIIWKSLYDSRAFDLRDGQKLLMQGSFDVYERNGNMSFKVKSFSIAGEGTQREKIKRLERKLRAEGLMDEERKREIPTFCSTVAVITSSTGAVINDVKHTLYRRNPLVELICVGTKVQGEGAPQEIIRAFQRVFALDPAPDCILIVRGGGSNDDLMTFNDEALARTIAASPIPVIAAIGHDGDVPICQQVADKQVSTPTAAAEIVAPSMRQITRILIEQEGRLKSNARSTLGAVHDALDTFDIRAKRACDVRFKQEHAALDSSGMRAHRAWDVFVKQEQARLDGLEGRPCLRDPAAGVYQRAIELEQTQERLCASASKLSQFGGILDQAQERLGATTNRLNRLTRALDQMEARFRESVSGFGVKHRDLASVSSRLDVAGRGLCASQKADMARMAASLDALSPLKVLGRGYAIAYGDDGVRTSVDEFSPGDTLRVRLADGDVNATVSSVRKQ